MRAALLVGVVICGGCAKPAPELVWVDPPAANHAIEVSVSQPKLVGTPAKTLTLPGVKARSIADPAANDNIAPDQGVKFSQERAFRVLVSRLRRYYETETQKFAREKAEELDIKESATYRSFQDDLRYLFDQYADKRSPMAIKLALYAGFPDPDLSQRGQGLAEHIKAKRVETAKALIVDLKAIEVEFNTGVNALLGGIDDRLSMNRAAMVVQIEEFRTKMDQRADQEAADQIRTEPRLLDLQLASRTDLRGPAIQPRSTSLPAVNPYPQTQNELPQKVSSKRLADTAASDFDQDLRIWVAVRGLQLAKSPAGARNATQEFLAWRKTFQDGR